MFKTFCFFSYGGDLTLKLANCQSLRYRLVHARQTVEAAKFTTLLKQETLTFEEVDFSQCNLTSDTLKVVLEICKRCPKLKVLKLFKNQLDDSGAEGLAEMLGRKPAIEEVHLSHNLFTAAGCRCLVEACERVRPEKCQPLWLRLEQNNVADPETVCDELVRDFSVCKRSDEVRCTVRVCVNKKKVHIPFFHLQRTPTTFVSRAEREAQAKQAAAAKARPVPIVRTISAKSNATPKVPKPSAWGAQGARPAPAEDSPETQSGYPSLGDKSGPVPTPETEVPKLEDAKTPSWKAGCRTSIVLDGMGKRRTMPEQLEVANAAFICTLCRFVMVKPVITRCSHLFCGDCFHQYARNQVELHKSQKMQTGPVPQIRCPFPECKDLLKKSDVGPLTDGGALQRLRNNLRIRCVHHQEHYKYEFGKDAERLFQEQGMSCEWSGPPGAYEEHMAGCPIENFLKSQDEAKAKAGDEVNVADDATLSTDTTNNESTRSQYEAEPEPEDSVTVLDGSAPVLQDSNKVDLTDDSEVRVAVYDYTPAEGVEGQIAICKGDLLKVFKVTETGWAAGVKTCRETKADIGEVGWFPAGYLAEELEEHL
ncbi:unnamed protein product [Symbiodinium microadriaticum]|nr:unnamed protein product [Symbiodinium sp. KB8]CAE7792459.1 unnamed protein product [Symbiodinium microadriaticum]